MIKKLVSHPHQRTAPKDLKEPVVDVIHDKHRLTDQHLCCGFVGFGENLKKKIQS